MASYGVNTLIAGSGQAMTTSFKTLLEGVCAAGVKRPRVYSMKFGAIGLPASADCDLQFDVIRITATGTGSAATPNPLDPADGACTSTWKANDTVEPTTTGTALDNNPGNQRVAWAWATTDKGQMLVFTGTSGQGLAFRGKSAGGYTNACGCDVKFDE
jgi:hypothetical protein